MASAPVGSDGRSLLSSGLPRLLGALWLRFLCTLLRLGFLDALRLLALCLLGALWLGFLRPLLRLGFLGALLWLRFLRVLLRLRFLGVLRLRLVLCRLGFCAASALFLLSFFC
jgi:hypothetical protein